MTIRIELPADLQEAVKQCADQDKIPVEDFVRQSVEQTISNRRRLDRIRTLANTVTRDDFLKSLSNVPDVEPDEFDRI